MMYDFILNKSLTFAQQGQILLRQANIRSFVMRAPRCIGLRGCAYGLKVDSGMGKIAASVLREKHLPYEGIFELYANGTAREVWHDLF